MKLWAVKKPAMYFVFFCLSLFFSIPAHAGWWDNLWFTPNQQGTQLLEEQDYTGLQQMDDAKWQGIGHYHSGDHEQAAEQFALHDDIADRYNQATALTQSGDYDKAIELFDDVLQREPGHENATHNRAIAEQLKQLQQQEQQEQQEQQNDSQGEQGDEGEQGENQSGDASEQQSQDSNADQSAQNEGDESGEQNGQQNPDASDASSDADDTAQSDPVDEQSEESTTTDAESADSAEGDSDSQTQSEAQAGVEQEPLTEQEQATEQWLRRIPDDPAGLLRRKLQRSHATEYPNVGNGESPW